MEKLMDLTAQEEKEVAQAVGAAQEPGIPHEVQLMRDTAVVQYIRQKILEQQGGSSGSDGRRRHFRRQWHMS